MTLSVVHEYTEDVIERRTRTVHVVETRRARIHAWHGGAKVADLGAEGSVPRAVEEANRLAGVFGIGPGSTMRIRVEEQAELTRRVVAGVDGDRVRYDHNEHGYRNPVSSLRRHAWDVVTGPMPVTWSEWAFSTEQWLGFAGRPADAAVVRASYAGVSLDVMDPDSLYGGFGHGSVRPGETTVETAEAPSWIRDRRGLSVFVKVTLRAACDVAVPPDRSFGDTLAFLSALRVTAETDRRGRDILIDFNPDHACWSNPAGVDPRWTPVARTLAHASA